MSHSAVSQPGGNRGLPVAGILFRRADCRAHLGGAHGHRSPLRRLRQRHDEFWLWPGRPGVAFQFWLSGGPHRQLGFPVPLLDIIAAGGSGARCAPEARPSLQRGLRPTAGVGLLLDYRINDDTSLSRQWLGAGLGPVTLGHVRGDFHNSLVVHVLKLEEWVTGGDLKAGYEFGGGLLPSTAQEIFPSQRGT